MLSFQFRIFISQQQELFVAAYMTLEKYPCVVSSINCGNVRNWFVLQFTMPSLKATG